MSDICKSDPALQEIEGSSLGAKVYMAPRELRKRKEYVRSDGEEEVMEANPDATGVELHKDSRFYASWQSFKDNNPVVNKFVDIRVKVYSALVHVVNLKFKAYFTKFTLNILTPIFFLFFLV